jgi:cytosine/adenosine deaminase-related metal-dependent hydrolase
MTVGALDCESALKARWVFPVTSPPLERGIIELAADRIRAVRESAAGESGAVDLGDVAIIPGLVNAHAHLEFSLLRQPLQPPRPFAEWIRSLVTWRRCRTDPMSAAVAAGLRECSTSGTTTVGEIATPGWRANEFHPETPRGVVFRESIALDDAAVAAEIEAAREFQRTAKAYEGPSAKFGYSPHAPYSVAPRLIDELVSLAGAVNAPLAMHLAETEEELELLRSASGPLVDLFRTSGFWREGVVPRDARPLDYLRMLAPLRRVLVIHGNYLDDEEQDFLEQHPSMTVVYCPRTHAWFGHRPHPWRDMLDRGIRVALGTDGRCSNPDLSLWGEVQFLHRRFPEVQPSRLLELATHNGAAALGLEDETGSLAPGHRADLAVVQLANVEGSDPHARLLHPQSRVIAAMRDGRWITPAPAAQ